MNIVTSHDAVTLGRRAADDGAELIRKALWAHGLCNIILATGTSQLQTLEALTAAKGIDWSKVNAFHLDEYIGLPATHPASFRHYLKKHFADKVRLRMFHYIQGDAKDVHAERRRIGYHLSMHPIDVAFIGIGENGHLAFNDPPADFWTEEPFIVVQLDPACRRQQVSEGWFKKLEDVPHYAITMSIPWIMRSAHIICSVPDERKAQAVRDAVQEPVSPDVPATILQQHVNTTLYLDRPSASLLKAGHVRS
jgi:glucosamine-6-phosphate deaminase